MLTVNQLTIGFNQKNNQLIVVEAVDLLLYEGETLALLGESGCGKSLTALGLIRLLPTGMAYNEHSAVFLHCQDLLNLPESVMRTLRGRRIAMIFQEPMIAMNPVLTIAQQLKEALLLHERLSAKEVKSRLIALLEKVEIDKPELRLKQYPHQLSGGQKQRIMIAMALLNNPEILIADEPTTALDVATQSQILKLLQRLQQEYRMSILLISHDLGVVKAIADRVCIMYAGQLVEQATTNDFFSSVKHPYSQQLLAALPRPSKRGFKLPVINGQVPSIENKPTGCYFSPRCRYTFATCKKQTPPLQSLSNRQVRCHLYPDISTLPSLKTEQSAWPESTIEPIPLLRVEHLTIHFGTKRFFKQNNELVKAVDDVSFTLCQGKTLALVGKSGCGKTTISRAILKLIPLTAGAIYYRNTSVATLNKHELPHYRKNVQIIFQDPYSSMNPRQTVSEILTEGLQLLRLTRQETLKRQLELLDQVNLPANSLTRFPHQFSGGQRQRICIARALATKPSLLVCDEPTSALDVSVQAQILNLLKSLQLELGLTYLFITHNMDVVSYIADEMVVMKEGKLVEQGSYESIATSPKDQYTKHLLSALSQEIAI